MAFPKDFLLNQAAEIVERVGGLDKTPSELYTELCDYIIHKSPLNNAAEFLSRTHKIFDNYHLLQVGDQTLLVQQPSDEEKKFTSHENGTESKIEVRRVDRIGQKDGLFEQAAIVRRFPEQNYISVHIDAAALRSDPTIDKERNYELEYNVVWRQLNLPDHTPVSFRLSFGEDVYPLKIDYRIDCYGKPIGEIDIYSLPTQDVRRNATKADVEDFLRTLQLIQ